MAKIAVLYGTTQGQTGKIAQRVAGIGRQHGHQVDVVHLAEVDASFDIAAYDGVMVGASIHEGSHQRYVYRWLKAHQAALASMPTAAFTVCLAIRSLNEDERAEARAFSGLYQEKTGWTPDVSEVFAGALMYSEYNWLVRMVMKSIARHEGGSTDTSHDTEYTDWTEVERFAEAFFSRPELNRRGEVRALP
jgi:menaquinone-dependent protoporphyrinogen oxidase